MQYAQIPPTTELFRIPGLFRRWELPDVLRAEQDYRIEEAGLHEDGTLLLAPYSRPTDTASEELEPLREVDCRPQGGPV